MSEPKVRKTVVINNPQGFHMRPVQQFVQLASRFDAEVLLTRDDRTANGKSMVDLLTLLAEQGAEVTIETSGHDAEPALAQLAELIQREFDYESDAAAGDDEHDQSAVDP